MYLTRKVELEEKIEGFIVYLLSVAVGVDVVSGEVYRCLWSCGRAVILVDAAAALSVSENILKRG